MLSLWSAADAEPTVTDDVSALEPEIDGTDLVATFSPSIDEDTIISGNADRWTAEAGYNQDLGIFVSVDGGTPQPLAWEESAGFAGTFSPDAVLVETAYPVTAGNTYVFSLWWKTNRSASPAVIYAGAGPPGGPYSPSSLVVGPEA